jgi:hypothetical protein
MSATVPPSQPQSSETQTATDNAKSNAVVRWLLILPAACAGYALVMFVTLLFCQEPLLTINAGDGKEIQPIQAILGNIIAAIVFIFVGTKTAPKHKIETAISLAVFFSMTYAILFTVSIMRGADGFFTGWSGFCGVISIISAIGASISVCRNEIEAKRIAEIRKKRSENGVKTST